MRSCIYTCTYVDSVAADQAVLLNSFVLCDVREV